MITQDLLDYIKSQRESGVAPDTIKQNLLTQGWTAEDVNEGFMKMVSPAAVPAAAPAETTIPALSTAPISPIAPIAQAAPITPIIPTTPVMTAVPEQVAAVPTQPMVPTQSVFSSSMRPSPSPLSGNPLGAIPPISTMSAPGSVGYSSTISSGISSGRSSEVVIYPKKSHGGMIALVILLFLIVVGGGVAYASYSGFIPSLPFSLPFLSQSQAPYDNAHLLGGIAGGVQKIKSSGYQLTVNAQMEKRDPDAVPFSLPSAPSTDSYAQQFLQMQQSLNAIPSDFNADATISGSSDNSSGTTNGQVAIVGSLTMNGTTFNANLQAEKIGDVGYIMINQFPTIFINLSPILQKWIKLSPSDLSGFANNELAGMTIASSTISDGLNSQITPAEVQAILALADQDKIVEVVGQPVKDTIGSESVYRYDLSFNQANFLQFMQDSLNYLKQNGASQQSMQSLQADITLLQDPSYVQVESYLMSHTAISLWVDGQGIPVKIAYDVKLIPSSLSGQPQTSTANQQLEVAVSLLLNNINQSVTISAPATSMSVQEAEQAVEAAMFSSFGESMPVSSVKVSPAK